MRAHVTASHQLSVKVPKSSCSSGPEIHEILRKSSFGIKNLRNYQKVVLAQNAMKIQKGSVVLFGSEIHEIAENSCSFGSKFM